MVNLWVLLSRIGMFIRLVSALLMSMVRMIMRLGLMFDISVVFGFWLEVCRLKPKWVWVIMMCIIMLMMIVTSS